MYSADGITQDVQARRWQAGHDIKRCVVWFGQQALECLLLFIPTPTETAKHLEGFYHFALLLCDSSSTPLS